MDYDKITADIIEMIILYGPKLVGAILVWIVGSWVIKGIMLALNKALEKGDVDQSLKPFIRGLCQALLKVLLVITVLSMLGIEMTSFIAILGAAGLAIGMALSGTLQNFAGGVMILIFKPYEIGDVIDAQGYIGKVSEIQIFNTIMKTPDNKTIIIPNGPLATGSMINYSTEETRRVDWTFGIGYGDDVDQAKQVMRKLCDADERILKDPEVFIAVSELADSSVNFAVRAWVDAADYWDVYFAMNEQIYKVFNQEGLNIPYPQMDVHVHKSE
ncbi:MULTISPECIES: mechanosensitive ion channel domain-containing protein [unclassified Thalassotalea]|uniref:mechanosensitive ion channel family protein n=1 Tax=unclassified Thalassotalea TaxID=2614972 RepID=UPI00107FEE0A|nr:MULTISPECIES: mechanosensitive ion channel domain-containing protein [unclassified Thalassotalea]NMP17102.1 mechanosensitive ion channel [Thalassotalea sp. Y01]QBY03963.1 mechanosensitive ion channel [Thalassotalea sp. HSM 43]